MSAAKATDKLPQRAPDPMAIRVLIADDHRLVREGLRALLAREGDIQIVGEAQDGLTAITLSRRFAPDVLLADIAMPGLNGIETVRRLHAEMPAVRVICLSVHDEQRTVLATIEAGACGYLLKDTSFEELAAGIRQVMAGRVCLSAALVGMFVEQYRGRALSTNAAAPKAPLTPRERELVQLFSEGFSTSEIASRLHVSAKTVATHRENILHKLHITGIAEMTRYALREGISSLDTPCRTGTG